MSLRANVVNFVIVISVLCICLVSQETVNVESTRKKSELTIVVQVVDRGSLLLRNSITHSAEQDAVDSKNRKSRSGHAWLPKSSFFTQHSSLLPRRGQNIQPSDPGVNVTGQTWGSWSMTEVVPNHRRGKRSNAVQRLYDISSAFTPAEEYYYFNPQIPLPAENRDFYPYGLLTPSPPLSNILHYQCQSESIHLADFNNLLLHAENNGHTHTSPGYFPQFHRDKNQLIFTQSSATPPNHNGCCNNHPSPHNDVHFSLQPVSLPRNVKQHYVPQPSFPLPTNKRYQGPQDLSSSRNFKKILDLKPPPLQPNKKEYYGPQPPSPPPNIKEHYSPQPPSPPPSNKGYCCPQPPSPPPNIKEHYGPQPPSPPPNIKEYYGPQPPSPPPNIKEHYGPQPPSPPPNIKEHYGPQPPSPPPSNKGYYDLKYLPFIPISNGYNGLRPPFSHQNNEGYFSLKPSATLSSDKGYYDPPFVSSPSSKEQHELHPPYPSHKGPYSPSPPFPVSDDYAYYTTKHQFAPLPSEHNHPLFEDNKSLQSSVQSSLVEVSVIPSLSFTLQDVTQVGSPSVVLEDPLTLAQNMSFESGAVTNRRSLDRHI